MLLERVPLAPAEAIRRLTPLQAQFAPAPYIALAARLDGFRRDALEAAFAEGDVVKTTIMRATLHAVAADEYAAYAQLARQARLRNLHKVHGHLDLDAAVPRSAGRDNRPPAPADHRHNLSRQLPVFAL